LRAFLPAMLLVLLLEGLMDTLQPAAGSVNLALWNSLTALLAAALIVALTGWTARRTGDAIERAEEELPESRALLQTVISGTSDAVYAKDQQGRYLMINRAAERFTGKTAASVLGQSDAFLFPPAEAAAVMEEDRKVIETGTTVTYEEEVTTSGGRLTAFLSTKGPLWDASGRCQGLFVIARDITDRKRAEAEKAKLEAQLQQAQKMESIGRLAGGVAHDFNNLLAVINGYSQLLLAQLSASDPLRAGLVEISKAGERAAALTRQLLAFSRKQVLEPRVLDLNQVVEEMRSMLGRVVGEDVEVRVALHAEAGMVHADPHQLEQVLMNVVVNARDAMPGGGKLLIETARVGRYVMLAVSDNGVGMDEQTQRQIFEPFFTTKGAGQGTGLGLSMVQGIVAQSGGYINVYSEPGQGTTFKIYLPAPAETVADAGKPETVAALGGRETVLVVEDQAEVRAYAVAVLKAYGYRVVEAGNAGEALLLCERDGPRIDLVLTDVVMPNMSGRELAQRLGKLQLGIKVLFMSGYTDEVIVNNGVLEEGAEFIQKPFSPEQLAGKIRAVLGPPAPPARIVVADDEAGVRGFLRVVLERGGYEVIEAADGKQALKEARAEGVGLVITDLVMPKQEGIRTIQALRKEMPHIRIIAITGKFEGPYLKMIPLLGADAVLTKPLSAELLLAKVAEVLKPRQ
jgi:PAS domain S-box-containing protein